MVIHLPVVDHFPVNIGIVDDRCIYTGDGGVVPEYSTCPKAAGISDSRISTTVIYAAIKADMRAPIPGMPNINPIREAPVSGRPEKANLGRSIPVPRNPIIAFGFIKGPIAGHPYISLHGTWRLNIDRDGRRCDPYVDAYAGLRFHRDRTQHEE
jgi:hypothetical protein